MRLLLCFLFVLWFVPELLATHILGGFIQTTSLPGQLNTQKITVVMYYDRLYGANAAEAAQTVSICFGDNSTAEVKRTLPITFLDNNTISVNRYEINHTYNEAGVYQMRAVLINRSSNLQNVTNSASVNNAFAIQTTMQVGLANQTPSLTLPVAALKLALYQRASFSVAGTDADGDSLSYEAIGPLTSTNPDPTMTTRFCNSFVKLPGYVYPNDLKQIGTYRLAPQSGLLTWDVPTEQGRYIADVQVSEWRGGLMISQTTCEIMLLVTDQGGTPVVPPAYVPALTEPVTVPATITAISVEPTLQLTVSPNPAGQGLVQAELTTGLPSPAKLQLTDGQGRIWQSVELRNNTTYRHQFDLSHLPAGVYLISAESSGRRLVKKVVRP